MTAGRLEDMIGPLICCHCFPVEGLMDDY